LKKKIIFILSAGRSGSTLLDKALGSHSRCFSLGEIVNFSSEFSKNQTLCGCGQWLSDCSFWKQVNHSLQKKDVQTKPSEYNIKNHNPYTGIKKSIYGLANILGYYNSSDKKILKRTKYLFDTITEISGKNIFIDSSKSIGRSFLLKHFLKDYDVFFIHLIRNGKAVLNSRKKDSYTVKFNNNTTKKFYSKRTQKSSKEYSERWRKYNLKVLRLMQFISNKKKYTVKYEDFINHPETQLKQIADMIGVEYDSNMQYLYNDHNHILGGNPSRVNAQKINPEIQKRYPNLTEQDIQVFEQTAGKLNNKLNYN
jgi:hypothetical protein